MVCVDRLSCVEHQLADGIVVDEVAGGVEIVVGLHELGIRDCDDDAVVENEL